jgi:hypothetical protein
LHYMTIVLINAIEISACGREIVLGTESAISEAWRGGERGGYLPIVPILIAYTSTPNVTAGDIYEEDSTGAGLRRAVYSGLPVWPVGVNLVYRHSRRPIGKSALS